MIETIDGHRYGYVSGPMRGIARFNFPAFDSAAAVYEATFPDAHAFSPAANDRTVWPECELAEGFAEGVTGQDVNAPAAYSFRNLFVWDVEALSKSVDIVLLPGWETSVGAALELSVAKAFGLDILYAKFVDGVCTTITTQAADCVNVTNDPTTRALVDGLAAQGIPGVVT